MKLQHILKLGIIGSFLAIITLNSCKKDVEILSPKEVVDTSFAFRYPAHWPKPIYDFSNNPLTREGFELGKRLFNEVKLSRDNTISCGTCHQPFAAFAQIGHDISHGIDNRFGVRNSQSIFNVNWSSNFFWDGGANHLEVQPVSPINNADEMGSNLVEVIQKLNDDTFYVKAFKRVFDKDSVDSEGILKAFAQFMGMLISADSKYDKVKSNQGVQFTAEEAAGYTLFKNNCNSCHQEPLFTTNTFFNNGLPLINNAKGVIDLGRGHIDFFDSTSYYKYKVPSLRNLTYTAPYMHDGRLETIEEVLDHYTNKNNYNTINLAPQLQNGISLSPIEKQQLIAFLKTLDDPSFTQNPLFRP